MEDSKIAVQRQLERQYSGSTGWFYWIAGLTLINTISFYNNFGYNFIVGLGTTQIATYLSVNMPESLGNTPYNIGVTVTCAIIALFVLIGYLAKKRTMGALIIGMILYGLDALLFVSVRDYISIGFHVFVLYQLSVGYRALGKLRALEAGPDNINFENELVEKKVTEIVNNKIYNDKDGEENDEKYIEK